jgi:hypothetical protein
MRILFICDWFYSIGGVQEVVDRVAIEFKHIEHHIGVMSALSPDNHRMRRTEVEFLEENMPEAKPVS